MLAKKENLDYMEEFMLPLEQAECPVVHHFGPGIYIREVHLPAGIFAIGHAQRFEHLNIMLKGAVMMTDDDGNIKTLRAPLIFTGKPGRKFGLVIEDTVWQNIYATTETDIETLEATYLDKSATWKEHDLKMFCDSVSRRNDDREDFKLLISQIGISEELVREQSENEDDQIDMPSGYSSTITIRNSSIEGKGVFLSSPVKAGDVVGPARIKGKRTPLGRYANHSKRPNSVFEMDDFGDIYLVALKDINGCTAGDAGEEITVDYRQALSLSGRILESKK